MTAISTSEPTLLDIRGLRKVYAAKGRAVTAVQDLTFGVRAGELVCVVGPSGAGKTTLLRVRRWPPGAHGRCRDALRPASTALPTAWRSSFRTTAGACSRG